MGQQPCGPYAAHAAHVGHAAGRRNNISLNGRPSSLPLADEFLKIRTATFRAFQFLAVRPNGWGAGAVAPAAQAGEVAADPSGDGKGRAARPRPALGRPSAGPATIDEKPGSCRLRSLFVVILLISRGGRHALSRQEHLYGRVAQIPALRFSQEIFGCGKKWLVSECVYTVSSTWLTAGCFLMTALDGPDRRAFRKTCACLGKTVLSVQKVLSSSGRATRRWPMYSPIRRSLPAQTEPDNTVWASSTSRCIPIAKWDAFFMSCNPPSLTIHNQLGSVRRRFTSATHIQN